MSNANTISKDDVLVYHGGSEDGPYEIEARWVEGRVPKRSLFCLLEFESGDGLLSFDWYDLLPEDHIDILRRCFEKSELNQVSLERVRHAAEGLLGSINQLELARQKKQKTK